MNDLTPYVKAVISFLCVMIWPIGGIGLGYLLKRENGQQQNRLTRENWREYAAAEWVAWNVRKWSKGNKKDLFGVFVGAALGWLYHLF